MLHGVATFKTGEWIIDQAKVHLASSLHDLVKQLGIERYGGEEQHFSGSQTGHKGVVATVKHRYPQSAFIFEGKPIAICSSHSVDIRHCPFGFLYLSGDPCDVICISFCRL